MELKLAMDLTPEELFETIALSLEYDIKQSTGKTVRAKNIKPGYSYIKKLKSRMGQTATVTVTIEEFKYPEAYVARFDSQTGKNWIKYYIEPIEDNQIGLSYIEEFDGAKKSYSINSRLFEFVLSIPNKRNLKKKFREMEQAVIASRGKTAEEKRAELLEFYDADE